MPSYKRPAAGEVRRARRLPGSASVAEPARDASAGRTARASEAQVRSMFDRIAGRYDLMNSVMSAGLHHRWRARAADLASLGAGRRALDVCCGTGDLALELARRVGPAARSSASTSRSRCSNWRAKSQRDAASRSNGYDGNALELPFRIRASTPRRSGSASATSLICERGSARWRAWCARRACGDPRDHDAEAPAPELVLLDLVRPHRAAARRGPPVIVTPTATCRSPCAGSHRRRSSRS